MALGAAHTDVIKLVVRQAMTLALVGSACGLAAAVLLTRLMSGLLYGVRPTDPFTFGAVLLLVSAVALVAAYIPARRATRIDPVSAMRCE